MEKIVRKFHSFEEADNADYEYYRALSGNEKLQLLLDLVMYLRQSRRLAVCWPLKGAYSQTG